MAAFDNKLVLREYNGERTVLSQKGLTPVGSSVPDTTIAIKNNPSVQKALEGKESNINTLDGTQSSANGNKINANGFTADKNTAIQEYSGTSADVSNNKGLNPTLSGFYKRRDEIFNPGSTETRDLAPVNKKAIDTSNVEDTTLKNTLLSYNAINMTTHVTGEKLVQRKALKDQLEAGAKEPNVFNNYGLTQTKADNYGKNPEMDSLIEKANAYLAKSANSVSDDNPYGKLTEEDRKGASELYKQIKTYVRNNGTQNTDEYQKKVFNELGNLASNDFVKAVKGGVQQYGGAALNAASDVMQLNEAYESALQKEASANPDGVASSVLKRRTESAVGENSSNAVAKEAQTRATADALTVMGGKNIGAAEQNASGAKKLLLDVTVGAEQMALDIAIGYATGLSMMAPMMVRSYGGAEQTARTEHGADKLHSVAYGVASAGLEAATEAMWNAGKLMKSVMPKSWAGKVFKNAGEEAMEAAWAKTVSKMTSNITNAAWKDITYAIGSLGLNFATEGTEEMVSAIFEPTLNNLLLGTKEKTFTKENIKNILWEGLVGGLIGIGGEALATPSKIAEGKLYTAPSTINAITEIATNNFKPGSATYKLGEQVKLAQQEGKVASQQMYDLVNAISGNESNITDLKELPSIKENLYGDLDTDAKIINGAAYLAFDSANRAADFIASNKGKAVDADTKAQLTQAKEILTSAVVSEDIKPYMKPYYAATIGNINTLINGKANPTTGYVTRPGVQRSDSFSTHASNYKQGSFDHTNLSSIAKAAGIPFDSNTIVTENPAQGTFTFTQVDDFNGNSEPVIQSVKTVSNRTLGGKYVVTDNTPKTKTSITNKSAFVADTYDGFDVSTQKERETSWKADAKKYGIRYNATKINDTEYFNDLMKQIDDAKKAEAESQNPNAVTAESQAKVGDTALATETNAEAEENNDIPNKTESPNPNVARENVADQAEVSESKEEIADVGTGEEESGENSRESKWYSRLDDSRGAGKVAEFIKDYQRRRVRAEEIKREVSDRGLAQTSAAEQGIGNGSKENTMTILPDDMTQNILKENDVDMNDLKRLGVKKVILFSGTIGLNIKDASGNSLSANGYSDGNGTVWVCADSAAFSVKMIAYHEATHAWLANNPERQARVWAAMEKDLTPEIANGLYDDYLEAYAKLAPNMKEEDVLQELLCDAMGEMNRLVFTDSLNPGAAVAGESIKKAVKDEMAFSNTEESDGIDREDFRNSLEPPYPTGSNKFFAWVEAQSDDARKVIDLFTTLHDIGRNNKTPYFNYSSKGKVDRASADITTKFMLASEWNDNIKNNPKFAEVAAELASVLPKGAKDRGGFNADGTITPTPLEDDLKVKKSYIQRVIDTLPDSVIRGTKDGTFYELKDFDSNGKETTRRIKLSDKSSVLCIGGEEYRQALLNERRRLYAEDPTKIQKNIGGLSKDNWGAMGFIASSGKTQATGDFSTVCPNLYFNKGCLYCYRTEQLKSGMNNKLAGERIWYTGELLRLKPKDIERLNNAGGLRIQSFGDWLPQFTAELADVLYDAEKVGLQVKVITKFPSLVDVVDNMRKQGFGKNIYFNISCDHVWEKVGVDNGVLKGYNKERPVKELNGELYWKRALSIEEAKKYRDKYDWVNIRTVALNVDDFISDLMNPNVDVVTGYHGPLSSLPGTTDFEKSIDENNTVTDLIVEKLGNHGMPQFKFENGRWETVERGKNAEQQRLCARIEELGLQLEYYAKVCCVAGRCAACTGLCGMVSKNFYVKNMFNRDTESFKYWEDEASKTPLQKKILDMMASQYKEMLSASSYNTAVINNENYNPDRSHIADIASEYATKEEAFADAYESRYSVEVTDKVLKKFLDNQEYETTYKSMLMDDEGNLHSPMATLINGKYENSYELGKWYQATEHPENLLKKEGNKYVPFTEEDYSNGTRGYFLLEKDDDTSDVPARYNPYEHSSNLVINDQFKAAYKRPGLVTVEMRVPKSENSNKYQAKYAKDPTGWSSWKKGDVANALAKKGIERQLYLSRYAMPIRVLEDSEVAAKYKELLSGTDISVPANVVTPSLLNELVKAGVSVEYNDKVPSPVTNDARYSFAEADADYLELAKDPGKNSAKLQEMVGESAKNAGYDIKAYHGTDKAFTEFKEGNAPGWGKGIYLTDSEENAKEYGSNIVSAFVKLNNPYTGEKLDAEDTKAFADYTRNYYKNIADREDISVSEAREEYPAPTVNDMVNDEDARFLNSALRELGYDGIAMENSNDITGTEYVVFSSDQVKSADPITYDDNGNVIPLSERFNSANGDVRYSFVGENSTLDKSPLETAKQMERNGESSEDIRKATGWFKSYDGKWRFEIDDSSMKIVLDKKLEQRADELNRIESRMSDASTEKEYAAAAAEWLKASRATGVNTLDDAIIHDRLFEVYPMLRNVKVKVIADGEEAIRLYGKDEFEAFYNAGLNTIVLRKDKLSPKAIMHEVQHAIQTIEGFAEGANIEFWADANKALNTNPDVRMARSEKENAMLAIVSEKGGYENHDKALMYEYYNNDLRVSKQKGLKANIKFDEERINEIKTEAVANGWGDALVRYQRASEDLDIAVIQAQQDPMFNPYSLYHRTAGEIEARDVEKRFNMSEAERRAKRPNIDSKDVVFTRYSFNPDTTLTQRTDEVNKQLEKRSKKYKALAEKRDSYQKFTLEEFNSMYHAHKILGDISDAEKQERVDSIISNGFKSGEHSLVPINVMPANNDNSNVILVKYRPRKGETVLLVPDFWVEQNNRRGIDRVFNGYKPLPYEVIKVEYNSQPYYELYEKAYNDYFGLSNDNNTIIDNHRGQSYEELKQLRHDAITKALETGAEEDWNTVDDLGRYMTRFFNKDGERYSFNPDTTLIDETASLENKFKAYYKAYQQAIRDLNEAERQITFTKWKSFTQTSLADEVKKIRNDYKTAYPMTQMMPAVKEISEMIHNADAEPDWNKVYAKAHDLAVNICQNSAYVYDAKWPMFRDMKKDLTSKPLSLSAEAKESMTDYSAFAEDNRKYITLRAKGGRSVNDVYAEFQNKYGMEYFPNMDDEVDKLEQLVDVETMLKSAIDNPYDAEMQEASAYLSNEIIDNLMFAEQVGNLKEVPPTFADRMKAHYEERLANQKARYGEKLRKTEEEYKTKIYAALTAQKAKYELTLSEIIAHNKQVRENARNRKIKSDTIHKVEKMLGRLKNLSKKTTAANRLLIVGAIGEWNVISKRAFNGKTMLNMGDVKTWVDSLKTKNEEQVASIGVNELHIPESLTDLVNKYDGKGQMQIRELSTEDLTALLGGFKALYTQIQNDHRFLESKLAYDVYSAGMAELNYQKSLASPNETKRGRAKMLYLSAMLTPERYLHAITGYNEDSPLYRLGKEVGLGSRAVYDYENKANAMFDKWFKDKDFMKRITGKDAETMTIQGQSHGVTTDIEVTRGTAMLLYLHSFNEDNMNHLMRGGATLPNVERIRDGQSIHRIVKETDNRYTFTESQLKGIELTEDEKEFCKMVQNYYGNFAAPQINRVSETLWGYSLAQVKNYIPIITDTDFLATYESTKGQADPTSSVLNQGWMKERINGTKPVLITDVVDSLANSIHGQGRFVGLAIPVRNFNKVLNFSAHQVETVVDENGKAKKAITEPDAYSMRKTLGAKYGESSIKYIEKALGDIQIKKADTDAIGRFLSTAKGNYAKAVLNLNFKVAATQAASYWAAISVLGEGPVWQAILSEKKVDSDIYDIDVMQRYRERGFNQAESGDIRATGKKGLPKALDWISAVDIFTTRGLIRACEIYVNQNYKNLEQGSKEWNAKVAEVHQQVLVETQPNYSTWERPGVLRSDNALVRAAVMFKTQPFQNFNFTYDSLMSLASKQQALELVTDEVERAKLKAEIKEAKKKASNSMQGLLISTSIYAALRFAYQALRGKLKDYKDDDGEMDAKSVSMGLLKDVAGNISNIFLGGSELFDIVNKIITGDTYYGIEISALGGISDAAGAVIDLWRNTSSVIKDGDDSDVDWGKYYPKFISSISDILMVAGIPADNIIKDSQLLTKMVFKAVYGDKLLGNGTRLDDYAQMGFWGELGTNAGREEAYDNLYSAYGTEDYDSLYAKMLEDGFSKKSIDAQMSKRMFNSLKTYEGAIDSKVDADDKLKEKVADIVRTYSDESLRPYSKDSVLSILIKDKQVRGEDGRYLERNEYRLTEDEYKKYVTSYENRYWKAADALLGKKGLDDDKVLIAAKSVAQTLAEDEFLANHKEAHLNGLAEKYMLNKKGGLTEAQLVEFTARKKMMGEDGYTLGNKDFFEIIQSMDLTREQKYNLYNNAGTSVKKDNNNPFSDEYKELSPDDAFAAINAKNDSTSYIPRVSDQANLAQKIYDLKLTPTQSYELYKKQDSEEKHNPWSPIYAGMGVENVITFFKAVDDIKDASSPDGKSEVARAINSLNLTDAQKKNLYGTKYDSKKLNPWGDNFKGVDVDTAIKFLNALAKERGVDGSISNDDITKVINSMGLSDNHIKYLLWHSYNEKDNNNPWKRYK